MENWPTQLIFGGGIWKSGDFGFIWEAGAYHTDGVVLELCVWAAIFRKLLNKENSN